MKYLTQKIKDILAQIHATDDIEERIKIVTKDYDESLYKSRRKQVWITRPSYSMPIIRKIKEDTPTWGLLILDSIPINDKIPKCSLGFNRYGISLNAEYSLIIGRILSHPPLEEFKIKAQFTSVSENLRKLGVPLYSTNSLLNKRFSLAENIIEQKQKNLKKVFTLLEPIYQSREDPLTRKELERIARFAVYLIKHNIQGNEERISLSDTLSVRFNNGSLIVYNDKENHKIVNEEYNKDILAFKNHERMWMSEYINLLMSERRFLRTQGSQKEIIGQTIKKIINISEADKGCFIKYSTTTGKLDEDSIYHGADDDYWRGIKSTIKYLNENSNSRQQSRALRIIDRYFNEGITFELENNGQNIEQPIKDKSIRSYMHTFLHN
ncbi:MAG: hypothetical protein Q9M36_11855 [Sulfurovum sp.]|nr:hypothetical protein [Sulfurovum sp.]